MKTVVYFCIQNNSIIQEKLEQYHMKYDLFPSGTLFQEEYIRFTLYKEDPAYQALQEILPASSGSWLDFSKQELEEAPWLAFRSSNMKLNSMNPHTFAFSCPIVTRIGNLEEHGAYHQKQVAPYTFKPVKWTSNNHFYSSYEGGYETIFCDDYAKEIFLQNHFQGVVFETVMWYRKDIALPNVHQLCFTNILPTQALLLDKVDIFECPQCGRKKYIPETTFQLHAKQSYFDPGIDFYSTESIFGSGREHPILIASNRVYRILRNMKLIRNLCFEPVILTD